MVGVMRGGSWGRDHITPHHVAAAPTSPPLLQTPRVAHAQPHNATTQIKTQLPKTTNNKQRPQKKVVTTTIEPTRRAKGAAYDAYEYTARSHTYLSDATPAAKFTYDLSPIQVRSEGVCELRACVIWGCVCVIRGCAAVWWSCVCLLA